MSSKAAVFLILFLKIQRLCVAVILSLLSFFFFLASMLKCLFKSGNWGESSLVEEGFRIWHFHCRLVHKKEKWWLGNWTKCRRPNVIGSTFFYVEIILATFYFEIISKLQKHCNKITKNVPVCFTQSHQLFILCHIFFIFLSTNIYTDFFLNHLKISCFSCP